MGIYYKELKDMRQYTDAIKTITITYETMTRENAKRSNELASFGFRLLAHKDQRKLIDYL